MIMEGETTRLRIIRSCFAELPPHSFLEAPWLGRYAKGIFAGYGIFIATMVMTLTLRASIGQTFEAAWVFVQPLCYVAALGIWCLSLWTEERSPVEESLPKIEEDYQSLALLTRKGLLQAREFLGKAIRP